MEVNKMDPQTKPTEEETVEKPTEAAAKPAQTAQQSPAQGMKDNKMLGWFLSTILYPALFLGALFTSASMTFDVIGMILPRSPFMKWLAIGFFDAGALVWWLMYIVKAKGTHQRGASLMIFVIDLLGAVTMIAGELWLGGQTLATPPAWLGKLLINGTTIVMAGNLIAAYYFHANSPETREAAQAQELEDELVEEALGQARGRIRNEARQLGAVLATRTTSQIKYRMRLPMSENERASFDGEIVEGQAEDMKALPAPTNNTVGAMFGQWLKGFFMRGLESLKQSEPTTTTNSKP